MGAGSEWGPLLRSRTGLSHLLRAGRVRSGEGRSHGRPVRSSWHRIDI